MKLARRQAPERLDMTPLQLLNQHNMRQEKEKKLAASSRDLSHLAFIGAPYWSHFTRGDPYGEFQRDKNLLKRSKGSPNDERPKAEPADPKEPKEEVCRVRVQSWLNMLAYLVNLGITYGSLTGAFGATNEELSEKYQILVTPAGYAFAIWGAIFTWEGIFAVAQMFPSLSTSPVVHTVTPWWIFACCFQVAWTLFFAQDLIPGSLVCMLGILLSLVTAILRTDFLPEISLKEYFLLRAPFSLHCGWIIAASVLNINVLADYYMSSQETMLMLAMVCLAGIAVIVALFTFAAPRADPLIGLVAAWALLGIYVELENPENLLNMNKFNYIAWPQLVIESVRRTALVLSIASACAASIAIFRSGWQRMRASDKSLTSDDATAVI
ncbi:unnamed protein product [Cladocopium goreaui]|uniref:Uncharacterized protein n=1 Tax=Cladocopium goreaui TaxID=2562237 RepID=A0A9P1D924_9DINO|nr:unnamed protein product [Cladocopium goreaui]